MIKGIRHIGIIISDEEKSIDLYCKKLGFNFINKETLTGEFIERLAGVEKLTYIKLELGGQLLELYVEPHEYVEKYSHIALTVDDIDKLYKELEDYENIEFFSEPIEDTHRKNKVCFAFDNDSNIIEFVEELEK